MRRSLGLTTVLAICIAATPLSAQEKMSPADSRLMYDVLTSTLGAEPFAASIPKYITLFRKNSFDGELGYSARDRELQMQTWLAKIRAGVLEDFFIEDIDGNLTITADEMRVRFTFEAYNYNHAKFSVPPTLEDVEGYIADKTRSRLKNDLDGDGAISFDEIRVVARDLVGNARHRPPVPHMAPSLLHDKDGDGTISESEFLDLVRRVYDLYDSNGDERISRQERAAANRIVKSTPSFMSPPPKEEIPDCVFPEQDEELDYYVIGGYEGSAMTDVYFGNTAKAVEMVEIHVPTAGESFRLIASFRNETILRLDDPAARVRIIYGPRGLLGVVGAPAAKIVQTDLSCHLALWKPIGPENPNPESFYTPLLKRAPIAVLTDYTLGVVDLGLMTNTPRKRFADSVDIDVVGAQGVLWTHFVRFNPGGLVLLDPELVRYSDQVSKHTTWPQYAGLAQLAAAGDLRVLPRDGRNKFVKAGRDSIVIDGKRFRLSGGDDSITINGFVYTEEKPYHWIGRPPLRLRIEQPLTYPAGLNGAHSVTFVLPTDAAEPEGDMGASDLVREGPNEP